jgi:hypothetical protein
MIRKDFEELDFLLKQQYDAKKLAELKRKKIENVFKIDRIVLYIDDLDRCDVSIVIRVLEAIHLLLAFPLFVVVVGVDPRWMHNALNLKYRYFLKAEGNNSIQNLSSELLNTHTLATSYDYLEKIFQIPFVLKTIDQKGKDSLIMSQIKKKNEKIIPKPSDPNEFSEKKLTIETDQLKAPIPNINLNESNSTIKDQMKETIFENHEEVQNRIEIKTEEQTEIIVNSELLYITSNEMKFMQAIGFLIGESPRTIKRYINIYRIIRTHSKFEFVDNNEYEHYCAAMTLLGIITGTPEFAKIFLKKIYTEPDTNKFGIFINDYLKDNKSIELKLKKLNELIIEDDLLKKLGYITLDKFKKNIPLISRFSFRDLS